MPRLTEPSEKLLDLIYDAASDDTIWTAALLEIVDRTSSIGGFIFGADKGVQKWPFVFNVGIAMELHRVHLERHFVNPWANYMYQSPVGKLVRSDEILPLSELQLTPFHDEVLSLQEIGHSTMLSLAARDDFQVGLNICRSATQGPFTEDERRYFDRLYPHLRRSLLLGFRLDGYKALQSAAFHVLDRLSAGIMILNRGSRVVFLNSAARSMALDGGPLRLRNAGVTTALPSHSHRLERLIEAARRGTPAANMSISNPHDGRLFTMLVASIRRRDIDRFSDLRMHDPAVMLVITDPLRPLDIPAEWIMDAYCLTRAEANVALVATSGASVPEIAHRLGVSPNTVKTHLRRVFAKTGVSRQAELARLMASLAVVKGNGLISSEPNGN